MDGMNMNVNANRYLADRVMQEMVQGGPAHYRASHLATNAHAQYGDDLGAVQAGYRHRTFAVKLPGLPYISLRLPKWMLIGELGA